MSLWESLSDDIGHLIIERLPEVVEHIRFGVVCKRWCSIVREYHKLEKGKRRPLPMLLTPPNTITGTKPNLYALSCRGNQYQNLTLPLSYAYRYCGSSYGWLATQNPDRSVTLEYPFGGKVSYFHLPFLDARIHHCLHPQFEISRLIVSPNSTQDDYMVVAIYGGQNEIATIKSGEESWFLIKPSHEDRDRGTGYSDIIFHKGLVYAVTVKHKIITFDVGVRPPKVKILLSLIERPVKLMYLVQSTHMELLLVERHRGRETDGVVEHKEEEYDGGEVEQYDAEEYLEDYEGSSEDEEDSDSDWEEDDGEKEGYDGEENEEDDSEEGGEEQGNGEENEEDDGEEGGGEEDEVEVHERVPGNRFNYRVKVYRLHTNALSGKITKKIELSSLNGDALFLGDNMSVSFSAAPYSRCEPDTIYFTDDCYYADYLESDGPGSYNISNKTFGELYKPKPTHEYMPHAIWVFPPFPVFRNYDRYHVPLE